MATGKYAKVIDKLPRMLGSEPKYQLKVEAVKQAMAAETDHLAEVSLSFQDVKQKLGVPSNAYVTVEWTDSDGWRDLPLARNIHVIKAQWPQPGFQRHASALARDYAAIRGEKARIEDLLKEVNLRLEAVSQMMFDQYEAEGVTTMTVDGRPVAARLVPYATVSDHEVFRQWCMTPSDICVTCKDNMTSHTLRVEDAMKETEDGDYYTVHTEKLCGHDGHEFVGGGDLERKMSLPWQTTNKVASDMLAAGEELPPGVTVWAKQRFTLGGSD